MRHGEKKQFTLYYHDIFQYPLTDEEIILWQPGKLGVTFKKRVETERIGRFFFLKGKNRLVVERKVREKLSQKKIEIAKKGARIISANPTVKMVALTGALAMKNATQESDVDLLIICDKGTLWITRLMTLLTLDLLGIPRNSEGKVEKDKLCLNMWMDEGDLVWVRDDRNFYTAHEIAQIVPLVNKEGTYEKFIYLNRWVRDYWPNAAKILSAKRKNHSISQYLPAKLVTHIEYRNKFEFRKLKYLKIVSDFVLRASNFLAFKMQYFYMKRRITREIVTPTRAIFHPRDWGKIVSTRLAQSSRY